MRANASKSNTRHALARLYPERDEAGRVIFTLESVRQDNPVLLQRSYRGPQCLPPSIADRSCAILGIAHVLNDLNATLGTTLTFDSNPGLEEVLKYLIYRDHDFGMIYGILRRWWKPSTDMSILQTTFDRLQLADAVLRQQSVSAGKVTKPWIRPRRVWDLYSNRVLPLWVIEADLGRQFKWDSKVSMLNLLRADCLSAVSHAWVYPEEREYILTPINQQKWPVPIPRDTSLNDVRIELLNAGTKYETGSEYVWLDVLCLRQEGGNQEDIRAAEWEIDVPTIGALFEQSNRTFCYLNGLGRSFQPSDFNDMRHWCNRVWTLQEQFLTSRWCLLGLSARSPKLRFDDSIIGVLRTVVQGDCTPFEKALTKRLEMPFLTPHSLFPAIVEVVKRAATNEVDRVAAITFKLCDSDSPWPLYRRLQPVEDAWSELVQNLKYSFKNDLFYLFPEAGTGKFRWTPSWFQVTAGVPNLAERKTTKTTGIATPIIFQRERSYSCSAIVLNRCLIEGLDAPKTGPQAEPRYGYITFTDETGLSVRVRVAAYHQIPISSEFYVLVGSLGFSRAVCRYWAVGSLHGSCQQFTKQSTLQIEDDDRRRLAEALGLHINYSFDVHSAQRASPYVKDITLA